MNAHSSPSVLLIKMILNNDLICAFFSCKDDIFALYGWKALYGDVFRPPGKPMLLSALLGSGCQITLTIFGTLGIILKVPS